MNTWGYSLLRQGRRQLVLEPFQLNVQLYPSSANTYDLQKLAAAGAKGNGH